MYKLAITGGIGSGKTSASEYIKKKYDSVYIFNADKESKSKVKIDEEVFEEENYSQDRMEDWG